MSEFVNYNKRSIQLPPNCKDLTDLFKSAWFRKLPKGVAPPDMPVVLRNDSVTETLGNIEKYVAIVFDSRADGCHLTISSLDEKLAVSVCRVTDSITSYQFLQITDTLLGRAGTPLPAAARTECAPYLLHRLFEGNGIRRNFHS
jgi:hypothetical protein